MKIPRVSSVIRRLSNLLAPRSDAFLAKVSGVIHVGANIGQERKTYDKLGLNVLWIEPIPSVFEKLRANISTFSKQRAIQALITNEDNATYEFHIANNNGASSSILELKDHKDIWPNIGCTETISLKSLTLTSLLAQQNIEPSQFDAMVIDTQGSELLVLEGAKPLLDNFRFVKTEAADFESYKGCCQLEDLDQFMGQNGFRTLSRNAFAKRSGGGAYYDVTYERVSSPN